MIGTLEMTKPPKQKPIEIPSAVSQTEIAQVAHPRLAGLTETVRRVVDTIDAMRKRKHINERQYQTAERYRTCFATLYGVMGGVGDFERSRGGGSPGSPPAPHYMLASETVSEVRKYLYPKDYAVVHRVCCLGMTIQEAAEQLYDPVTRPALEDCGRRLREGLDQMADRWFPMGKSQGIRSVVMEKAGVSEAQHVPQGKAVHATGDKVYRSGK
jgi:hypothetical protein